MQRMLHARQHRRRHFGFTLIEVVIALFIAALLLSALALVLRATVEAKIQVEGEARVRRLGPNIMATISRDLKNAWGTGIHADVEIEGSYFRGEGKGDDDRAEDELWFVTSVNSYLTYEGVSSDLTEVGYYLKANADGDGPLRGMFSLYRREDFLVDKRPDEGGLGILLHDRVVSFKVRYYDLPRDKTLDSGGIDPDALRVVVDRFEAEALAEWDSADDDRLPYAVRVELVLDVTPLDAFNRNDKRRYAVYEALVRLPDYPTLGEDFPLLTAKPLPSPAPPAPPAPNPNPNPGG